MDIKYCSHKVFFCCTLLFLVTAAFFVSHVSAGIYTSTKHGTSADRSVVTPGFIYTTLGHCGQCHEQHASIEDAEMTPPAAQGPSLYALFEDNFGASSNELCYSCHETFTISGMTLGYGQYGIYQGKTRYDASVHNTSSNMVWGLDSQPDSIPPGPPYDDAGNCHNCHNPHGYDDGSGTTPIPSMLFAKDSQTGDSPAYEMGCEACHDGTQATEDVQTQLGKTYAHPTHTYNNRHSLPETGQPGGSDFGPAATDRHAECVDCHNPHTVGNTVHTAPGNSIASSSPLYGTWGVEPSSWPSLWTQPTTFTALKPPSASPNDMAQKEYQICFKCHSYYDLGAQATPVSAITGPSGSLITDQAWDFNRNNKAAHPVVVSLNNQTGSYAPKALADAQLKTPWAAAPGAGNQTMYCSDCHGADDEGSSAKGPHGSSRKYMLKGTGQYWPTKPDGTLWRLDNTDGQDSDLFCNNCHPVYDGSDWQNEAHARHNTRSYNYGDGNGNANYPCVGCHNAIPHGSRRSRFIVYRSEPAPYTYRSGGINYGLMDGFYKVAFPFDYTGDDECNNVSTCNAHQATIGIDP